MIFLADSLIFPNHTIALDIMVSQFDKAVASLIGGAGDKVTTLAACEA